MVKFSLKKNISFQLRPDLSKIDGFCAIFTIEVDKEYFNKEKNMTICALNRTDWLSLNEYLNILLDTVKNVNNICNLMGDFNINL